MKVWSSLNCDNRANFVAFKNGKFFVLIAKTLPPFINIYVTEISWKVLFF